MENVFVVVVTYNGIKWIEKCLNSILNSSIDLRIIVIDNGSTDGTSEFICDKYPGIILYKQKENLGFGAANNIGMMHALKQKASFLFLLNQDAWVEKETIKNLVLAQQKEPDYGIVSPIHLNGCGNALDCNFLNYITASKCKDLISDLFLNKVKKELYEVCFVNAAGWLISRECLDKVGGFNPSFFHYGEDDNYIQRLHYHALKVGVLANEQMFHDRENRSVNVYFDDPVIAYKRNIILNMSNPSSTNSFYSEYKKLYKNVLKSLLLLKFKIMMEMIDKLTVLNSLDKKKIQSYKNESKVMKSNFI